ncbi:OmpA family protein [Fibrella sp. HMF5335]|uniref:OmpA family protein n=1 Tax=Fibrella rubiginis TaxID=2817060 RepID=A0A939GBI4_9BACT|nr:OmpA family protein [Fibrella rubiginis]MBO0935839.1 OmpA family protein [Fibrella rubiginis]
MSNFIMNRNTAVALMLLTSLTASDVLTSCKSVKRNTNKTQRGAGIGAASGAVVGGVIGRKSGNTVLGAILGATVGGAAGAVIGRRMDKQAEELKRDLPNATVERVGEGIKITFNSDILFDVNKSDLKEATKRQLAEFAQTLEKYPDTDLVIEGHADAQGPDDYNLKLSRQRADAVASYLQSLGVKGGRIDEKGYGESQPVADNSTEAGRAKNRRVDIAVFANDKMKNDAKAGKIE